MPSEREPRDPADPGKLLPRRPGGPSERGGRRLRQPDGGAPEALASVLDGLSAAPGWRSGILLGRLGRGWSEVVGERLALETEPVSLEAGVLVIRSSSGAWAAQIRFMTEQLRARANEVLGTVAVREIRLVGDPDRGSR